MPNFRMPQQALKLGASDYILQPARYEVIENALQKAMLEQWEKKSLSAYSKQAMQEEKRYSRHVLQDFLSGLRPRGGYSPVSVTLWVPGTARHGVPVCADPALCLDEGTVGNGIAAVRHAKCGGGSHGACCRAKYGSVLATGSVRAFTCVPSRPDSREEPEGMALFARFCREEAGLQAAIYADTPAIFTNMPALPYPAAGLQPG